MPYGDQSDEPVMLALGEDYPELRESIRKICEGYPGAYWRKLEDEQAYPTEFIEELTRGGFLASLIPEEYGGSGLPLRAAAVILEEINASGCTASQGHAQMYIMGTLLRHGSAEQKQKYLPQIATGELRLQAFGVTEPTTGSDTTKLKTRAVREGNSHYIVNGQKVWTSRARHSDLMLLLARTTPVEEVKRRTDGLSVFLVDLRESLGKGLEIRPIDAMINHNTTEVFFDNLKIPADSLIGEEGKGFRYILDGMNAERILVAQECIGDGRWLLNKGIEYAK
ncbi:MAG TPA: acyl-CoA dehydrogenase family protein, partial [Stellaceae bacterium]|nr:acyl-CoA dehydrogenase family protein [Stellaceae bacterium]